MLRLPLLHRPAECTKKTKLPFGFSKGQFFLVS
jgi:hypothetical protein